MQLHSSASANERVFAHTHTQVTTTATLKLFLKNIDTPDILTCHQLSPVKPTRFKH